MNPLIPRGVPTGLLLMGLCSIVVAGPGAQPSTGQAPPATPPLRAVFDLVALDATGKPVLDLAPDDLQVTVGGQARAVRSLRFAYRGAGAELSARAGRTASPSVSVPQRVIVLAVDENAIRSGREKAVASSAWRVIDSLTPGDVVGVMALPRPRGQTQLGVDRTLVRSSLNALVGRAADDTMTASAMPTGPTRPVIESDADITGSEQVEQARRQEAAEAERRRSASDQVTAVRPQAGGTSSTEPSTPRAESFQTLASAFEQLASIPGQKFAIYLTGGDSGRQDRPPGADEDPTTLIEAAGLARINVHVVLAAENARARVSPQLERLARETGGTVTTLLAKKPDLGELAPALASGYIVELDPAEADRQGRVGGLSVTTTRKGVRIVVASRFSPRTDPLPEPEAPLPTSAPTSTAAPAEPSPVGAKVARGDAVVPDVELDSVLTRVSSYVDAYLAQFGSVVAEEAYQQTVRRGTSVVEARRTKADLLLVRSDNGWQPFRDVFEVNGQPVRDREERLRKLFLENPGQAMAEGRRISEESARYNLGRVRRTMNAPTVALSFFQSSSIRTFEYKRRSVETIDGTPVWRIDYREVGRPTQIVHGTTGADMPSTGAIYVEPNSGRVVRTVLQSGDASTVVEVVVKFLPNDTLGLWTPAQMTERYWSPGFRGDSISSEASYSSFRRFQVDTNEALRDPK